MADVNAGTVKTYVVADTTNYMNGMAKAAKTAVKTQAAISASMMKAGKSMRQMGRSGMLRITAPITLMGAAVLKMGGDFEMSMNKVRALSGATGNDLVRLSRQAKELGRTTQFSASQAADGMGQLALAGFETNQILGSMPKTLQLAAAAQIDLGSASQITANILAGYQLEVSDLSMANDVLVKTFTSTKVELTGLGQAMKFAGPVANAAGIAFTETAAALGLMGQAGFEGSMAGTAMRGAISKLLAPTKEAVKIHKKWGLVIKDANGDMLPFVDIVKQIEKAQKEATSTADFAGEMMEAFGLRAGPAMTALVSQGSDALTELIDKLENSGGTAKRIADVQMEGFNGQMRALKSSVEGAAIAIAESGLLRDMTAFAKTVTEVFRNLAETNPAILYMGTVIAGVVAVLPALLIMAGLLVTAIGMLISPVSLALIAIAGLGAAFVYFSDGPAPALFNAIKGLMFVFNILHAGFLGIRIAIHEFAKVFVSSLTTAVEMMRVMAQMLNQQEAATWLKGIEDEMRIFNDVLQKGIDDSKTKIADLDFTWETVGNNVVANAEGMVKGVEGAMNKMRASIAAGRTAAAAEAAAAARDMQRSPQADSRNMEGKLARKNRAEMMAIPDPTGNQRGTMANARATQEAPVAQQAASGLNVNDGDDLWMAQEQNRVKESARAAAEIQKLNQQLVNSLGPMHNGFYEQQLDRIENERIANETASEMKRAANIAAGMSMNEAEAVFAEERLAIAQQEEDALAELRTLALENQLENATSFTEAMSASLQLWAENMMPTFQMIAEGITGVMDQAVASISSAVAQSIVYGQNLGDALKGVFKQIAASAIKMLVKLGLQWVLSSLIQIGAVAAETGAKLAGLSAITYASAFASVVGFMGPAAAIYAATMTAAMNTGATAAGAVGGALGKGIVAGSAGGGMENVGRDSTFLLHKGERVLQAPQNEDLGRFLEEQSMNSGGGEMRVSIEMDGEVVAEKVMDRFTQGQMSGRNFVDVGSQ